MATTAPRIPDGYPHQAVSRVIEYMENEQIGCSSGSCAAVDKFEIGASDDPNGKYMEDRVVAKRLEDLIYVAVFDGHGAGRIHRRFQCVDYVSENLHDFLLPVIRSGVRGRRLGECIGEAFDEVEQCCLTKGYGIQNGTTVCVTVVHGRKLVIANLGDSRAFLCRNGKLKLLSNLHRPGEKKERERLLKEGVEILSMRDGNMMEHRLACGLSVCRAFGDFNAAFCDTSRRRARSLANFTTCRPQNQPVSSTLEHLSISTCKTTLVEPETEMELPQVPIIVEQRPSLNSYCIVSSLSSLGLPGTHDDMDDMDRAHVKDRYGRGCVNTKPRGLSSTPECREYVLHEEDEFLVIACDGVFDALRNDQAVVSIVRNVLADPSKTAKDAADELLRRCKTMASIVDARDNLSAAVVVFKRPPEDAQSTSASNTPRVYKNSALNALRLKRAGMTPPVASPNSLRSPADSPCSGKNVTI